MSGKNKKKREISNRLLYTLITIGILAIIGVGVYAYGTSNPSYFGHSAGELSGVCLTNGTGCPASSGGGNVSGSGAANNLTKWLNATSVGISSIVETGGNIGIGGPADVGNKLHVVGFVKIDNGNLNITTGSIYAPNSITQVLQLLQSPNLTTSNSANAWISPSDGQLRRITSSLRYKTDVVDLSKLYPDSLGLIEKLRPIHFRDKSDRTEHIGLAAEEVYKVIPELALLNAQGQPESVEYSHMVALLVAGIKEQQKTIDQIKTETCQKDSSYSWC